MRPGLSWLLPLPQLPSSVLVCTAGRITHLGRPGAGILGRSLGGVGGGGRRCILASDLGAPHSLFRERKRSGDTGKLRQEEQGSGPVQLPSAL